MNIQSAKYYTDIRTGENTTINIVVDGQTLYVPIEPNNRHYQAIQEWVAEGDTIEDAD